MLRCYVRPLSVFVGERKFFGVMYFCVASLRTAVAPACYASGSHVWLITCLHPLSACIACLSACLPASGNKHACIPNRDVPKTGLRLTSYACVSNSSNEWHGAHAREYLSEAYAGHADVDYDDSYQRFINFCFIKALFYSQDFHGFFCHQVITLRPVALDPYLLTFPRPCDHHLEHLAWLKRRRNGNLRATCAASRFSDALCFTLRGCGCARIALNVDPYLDTDPKHGDATSDGTPR